MFSPIIVFTVAYFSVSATMHDTQNPGGYDSLAGCQARLYEMASMVRQMPVAVKVLSAKCTKRGS